MAEAPEQDTNPRGNEDLESDGDVADAIGGLLDVGNDASELDDQGRQAQGAAAGETPPSGEDETDQGEPETPVIEAPVSWNAEEKKTFATLPPVTQQAILRRESEREAALSRASQETAEQKRAHDAFLQQASNERAAHANLLQTIVLQLQPELAQFNNVDWQRLSRENPAEWAAQRQAYDTVVQRINAAEGYRQQILAQNSEAQNRVMQSRLTEEKVKLSQAIPELSVPEKAKAFAKELSGFLLGHGLTQEEVNGISDHRVLLIARTAMLAEQAEKAKQAAMLKRVPSGSNVQVLRPAARQGNETAGSKRIAALHANQAKTGSLDDTAALIAGILG